MRVLPFRPRPVARGRPLPALLVRQHIGDEGHRAREPTLTRGRDSKAPHGPALVFPAAGWSSFIAAVKSGEFAA
ncbi:DUF397 domain-containing protein [Streptomyces atratus]|uniref:DUF397 domain-containing protein n=1 Tax=Streptomyces atratus TaxID=1893 RepID=UPI003660C386